MKCRCPQCQIVASVSSELNGKRVRCRSCQNVFPVSPLKAAPKEFSPPEDENDSDLSIIEPPPVENWIKELNREPQVELLKPPQVKLEKRPAMLALARWLLGMALVGYLNACVLFIVILKSTLSLKEKNGWVIFAALSPVFVILLIATFTLALSEMLRLMVRCEEYLRTMADIAKKSGLKDAA